MMKVKIKFLLVCIIILGLIQFNSNAFQANPDLVEITYDSEKLTENDTLNIRIKNRDTLSYGYHIQILYKYNESNDWYDDITIGKNFYEVGLLKGNDYIDEKIFVSSLLNHISLKDNDNKIYFKIVIIFKAKGEPLEEFMFSSNDKYYTITLNN